MTAKGVFLFLLLLLSSGSSLSFPNNTENSKAQESLAFEFGEEVPDLYEGTFPCCQTICFTGFPCGSWSELQLRGLYEAQSQLNYIRRSKNIIPGLDVSAIIFPFHSFL